MKTDRHVISLLKGKIYDKKRHYTWAVEEYQCALILCNEKSLPVQIIANLKMRLGWSRIRSKIQIDQGIMEMREANQLLPNNNDYSLKLATAIFSNVAPSEANDEQIMLLLDQICMNDPKNCAEALLLKGKLLHRQDNYKESFSCFQASIKLKEDT